MMMNMDNNSLESCSLEQPVQKKLLGGFMPCRMQRLIPFKTSCLVPRENGNLSGNAFGINPVLYEFEILTEFLDEPLDHLYDCFHPLDLMLGCFY